MSNLERILCGIEDGYIHCRTRDTERGAGDLAANQYFVINAGGILDIREGTSEASRAESVGSLNCGTNCVSQSRSGFVATSSTHASGRRSAVRTGETSDAKIVVTNVETLRRIDGVS